MQQSLMLMAIPTMIVLTSMRKKDLPSVQSRDHSVFAPIDALSLDCIRQVIQKHPELMVPAAQRACPGTRAA